MKLIVGLGNPGRKYEQTRHNVGFMVAAKVATTIGAGPAKARFAGEVAEGAASEKLVILCPHTYMNASGKSVRKACDFYKLSPEDLLVVCDDLNLPTGRIRIRASGSAGGQKGLTDIIRHLGTDEFPRLRIGIDRPPPGWETSDYVLGKFNQDEQEQIETAITNSAKAVIDWAEQGVGFAMNRYNAELSGNSAKATKPQRSDAKTKRSPKPTTQQQNSQRPTPSEQEPTQSADAPNTNTPTDQT